LASLLEKLDCVIVNKHVVNKMNKVSEERVKKLSRLIGEKKASKLVRKSVLSNEQAYKLSIAKLSEISVIIRKCNAPSFKIIIKPSFFRRITNLKGFFFHWL